MIILASTSPRRKEILAAILGDTPFEVVPSHFDERALKEKDLKKLCLEESIGKGKSVSLSHPGDVVIASDTMVLFRNKQIGKPKDEKDALETLRMLQGNTHEIVTAYCILKNGKSLAENIVTAELAIEKMADREIELYIETGSPLDKAGSYGVQDKDFITSKIVSGDESTIMGLPRFELARDLRRLGILK